ncbi:NTP transferase domain-containing protein [Candidatus Micrarchaeota archaeon]|nr:NTP transferase domain-containing protein [Candidatus Micrarchaeota archaeon]
MNKKREKERVTINIDSAVLKGIDGKVDGRKIRNRSHAIEYFVRQAMQSHEISTAFVLAGGKGTRLKPLTDNTPKPMIEVKGKPVLQYVIELLSKYQIKNVVIALGYKSEKIQEYFGNGEKFGLNIEYVIEKEPLGTGGPLRLAKDLLVDEFLMFNGDNLTNINLKDMFEFHKKNNAFATIALSSVQDPKNFGVIEMEGNKIRKFIEKPVSPKSNLINSGTYILKPEVIDMIPKGFSLIEKDVFPKLSEQGKLYGYVYNGQWFPTDTIERYEQAKKEWKGII